MLSSPRLEEVFVEADLFRMAIGPSVKLGVTFLEFEDVASSPTIRLLTKWGSVFNVGSAANLIDSTCAEVPHDHQCYVERKWMLSALRLELMERVISKGIIQKA